MKNENMYGWILTFNPYEDMWYATPRDNYNALFNGKNEGVLRVKGIGNVMTILDLINRTNGDESKLKELVNA